MYGTMVILSLAGVWMDLSCFIRKGLVTRRFNKVHKRTKQSNIAHKARSEP